MRLRVDKDLPEVSLPQMRQLGALLDDVHDGEDDEKDPSRLSTHDLGTVANLDIWIRRFDGVVKSASHVAVDVALRDKQDWLRPILRLL